MGRLPADPYSQAKAQAERLVLRAVQPGFTTIALRPPLIWGANNPQIVALRQAVEQHQRLWVGNSQHILSTLHVENLAARSNGVKAARFTM